MDQLENTSTRKNTKISFRTDEKTFTKLKVICRIENRTISSLIETLLTEHVLRNENPFPQQDEKRQSPRKKCSIPLVLSSQDEDSRFYTTGTLVNLSLSSMQIILSESLTNHKPEHIFHALFTLPTRQQPFLMPCQICRKDYIHGEYIVVAKLLDTDGNEFESIEKYLTTPDVMDRQ